MSRTCSSSRTRNIEKSASAPDTCAAAIYSSADTMCNYLALNQLAALPHDARELPDFFEARRIALAARVRRKLASGVADTQTEETAAEEYNTTELDTALDE